MNLVKIIEEIIKDEFNHVSNQKANIVANRICDAIENGIKDTEGNVITEN